MTDDFDERITLEGGDGTPLTVLNEKVAPDTVFSPTMPAPLEAPASLGKPEPGDLFAVGENSGVWVPAARSTLQQIQAREDTLLREISRLKSVQENLLTSIREALAALAKVDSR